MLSRYRNQCWMEHADTAFDLDFNHSSCTAILGCERPCPNICTIKILQVTDLIARAFFYPETGESPILFRKVSESTLELQLIVF